MSNLKIAKKGQVITITSGCYSSYMIVGVYKVSTDFRPYEELEQYLQKHPEQREDYHFLGNGFLSYLDQKGYLEEIPNVVLNLEDYGKASEVYFTQGF